MWTLLKAPLVYRLIRALCKRILFHLADTRCTGRRAVGVLYVRRWPRIRIEPQIHGGGHEQGIRSGTLATHQLVGMGEAAQLTRERRSRDVEAIATLDRRLLDRLADIEHTSINGNKANRVSGIVNVGFACVESESLMMSMKDVAIASGSACTSSRVEPSHVLRSLGLPKDLASCSVRFSLGRFTTEEEIDFAVACVRNSVDALRQLSPQWRALRQSSRDTKPYPRVRRAVVR